jgi:hypothetical protein
MATLLLSSAAAPLLLLAALALAPFQCGGGDAPEETRLEDTPGEALYRLAGEFEEGGDRPGRVRVLKHLVARYPKSRFAQTAQDDLIALGEVPPGTPPPGERDVAPADPAPHDPGARGGSPPPTSSAAP